MDALNHVNNATFLVYYESGRTFYGQELYLLDPNLRTGGVVAEATCRYLQQLRFPATFQVCTRISRIGNTSFDYTAALFYKDQDENPISTFNARMVCFDQKTQQKYRLPDENRELIYNYEKIKPEM
jgi:acyl-CoA thioester hydrolase